VKRKYVTKKGESKLLRYGHHEKSSFGAGPLRSREKKDKTYGICQGWCLSTEVEELNGGLCKWCLWYVNDADVGDE
jgi:hypothetical protein